MSEVTDEFLIAALNELTANGACNTINGVAGAVYRIKEEGARELEESFTREEIEAMDAYKNIQVRYDILINVANALDIGLEEKKAVRLSKIDELINDLIKIKKEIK